MSRTILCPKIIDISSLFTITSRDNITITDNQKFNNLSDNDKTVIQKLARNAINFYNQVILAIESGSNSYSYINAKNNDVFCTSVPKIINGNVQDIRDHVNNLHDIFDIPNTLPLKHNITRAQPICRPGFFKGCFLNNNLPGGGLSTQYTPATIETPAGMFLIFIFVLVIGVAAYFFIRSFNSSNNNNNTQQQLDETRALVELAKAKAELQQMQI